MAKKMVLIAGWRQWADAGSISSGLPAYLIEQTGARLIGEIPAEGYYLFQIPGTHHLMRPVVRFANGRRQSMEKRRNELYYTGDDETGVVIFLGDEPHMDVERYAQAFFGVMSELGVQRVVSLGGVYGLVPYDKDRGIGCIYSLPEMAATLADYALLFSDYEGGASIGSFMVDQAEGYQMPFVAFYGFVPHYDFSQAGLGNQEIRIENDYKAWYDIMRRVNHLLGLSLNLADLEERSFQLMDAMEAQIEEMETKLPQAQVRQFFQQLSDHFEERPFAPLDDVWTQGLADLFDD